jgi:hypothetical protein
MFERTKSKGSRRKSSECSNGRKRVEESFVDY